MSSHFATADVWVGNLDNEDELDTIAQLIEDALSGAGYQATVSVTAHPNPQTDGGKQ